MTRLGGTLASVSCPTAGLCMVGGSEHVYSTNPTGGRSSWHATGAPAGGGVLGDMDCPDITLCVGVGFGNTSPGLAVATASPRGGSKAWKTFDVLSSPPPTGAELLDAVGCAGEILCVALDTADGAYTTTTPVNGGWSWDGAIRPNSASQQNAIACTLKLCVVVDSAGVETTGVIHS